MAKKNSGDINKESLKAVEDFIKKTEQAKKNVKSIDDAFGNVATQLFGISGAAFFKEMDKTTEEIVKQKEELSNLSQKINTAYEQIGDTISGKFSDIEKSLDSMKSTTASIPEDFKKIAEAVGFEEELKTANDVLRLQQEVAKLREEDSDTFEKHKKSFEDFIGKSDEFIDDQKKYFEDHSEHYEKILAKHPDFMSGLNEQERIQALIQIQQKGLNGLVEDQSSLLKDIVYHSDGFVESEKNAVRFAEELSGEFEQVSQEAQKSTKQVFSLTDAFQKGAKNLSSGIIPRMLEYDQAISDAGKNFGFVVDKGITASYEMANLTSEAARFNMSVGDTLGLMGSLGEELATIDQDYLAGAVEHFVAIEKATGISSEEISTIAGEMMRAGQSAEQVESYMEGANKTAKLFGVNTKKLLQGVSRNIDKMRQMGFQGGEESLTRMVATAQRLRMNVDEIFDVAKRARTIEGAMDMATQLQLAGGSFANINPMDLLSAARKGPEELQKILTNMGDDIGAFNEDGEFKFDPVDVDRLQIVADATGQSLDSIQKMIQKNAEDAKKADLLGLSDAIPDEARNFLNDMTEMDGGKIEMTDELKDLATGAGIDISNVDDLEDLSQTEINALMEEKKLKEKTLAEQAEANQSFQDSISAFKDAILNLFVVFEPFIKMLTSFIQTLNSMPGPIKMLVGGLIAFAAVAPKLGMALQGFKAVAGGLKNMFAKGKKLLGFGGGGGGGQDKLAGQINKTADKGGETAKAKGSGGGLKSLAEGLKAMGDKKVFQGIGAVALAGPALVLLLPGMPTLLLLAGIGALSKLVTAGFSAIARGFGIMGSNLKNVLKGALAVAIAGAALIPFAFALTMFTDVDWGSVLMGIGVLTAVIIALTVIGALLMGPQLIALVIGVAALIGVGVGLMIFGESMMVFAKASQMMQGLDFTWLSDLGSALLTATPGLILAGLGLLLAAPGLALGGLALIPIVSLAERVSNVDWSTFAQMGDALLAVVPGLMAFSAGALIGGLMSGLGSLLGGGGPLDTLQMLAGIAMVAADPLMKMSDAIGGLADGIEKLSTAAQNLDVSKLEMLRSLAWSMAIGSFGGGMVTSIDKIAEALAKLANIGKGGSSKGGGKKKIEINLKLNGRDLQSLIVDDTEIVS